LKLGAIDYRRCYVIDPPRSRCTDILLKLKEEKEKR
jgi:hypothetical protein